MGTNLYLINLRDECESFYKIGVSCHKFSRFYQLMKFGYRATIIYMPLKLDFYEAYGLESYLQNEFAKYSYLPIKKFGGYRECFKDIDIEEYKKILNSKIKTNFDYLENIEITWR